jgi:ATP-dependent Clp protease ATP-binding subunit ClpC
LTEPVRRRPYSVVLLDEIEKAHPEVWNILLQVLDDGRLTDGEGRTVDFTNTVIVMTSNLGAGPAKRSLGFTATEADPAADRMREAAKRVFLPEFLGRIDELVVFDALTEAQVTEIAAVICGQIASRVADERGIELVVTPELIEQLARDGFDAEFGARPLKRHIRRTLEKELTQAILDGTLVDGTQVVAELDADGAVALNVAATVAA